ATDLPLRMYLPSVGESSRPRIDSSVDLPHPEGPAMAMYSPVLISRWIPASACVSTSSVKKTLVTPSRWISVGADVFIVTPLSVVSLSLAGYSKAVLRVLRGHIGQNHRVAGLQPLDDFDLVHGAASELHGRPDGLAVRVELEE